MANTIIIDEQSDNHHYQVSTQIFKLTELTESLLENLILLQIIILNSSYHDSHSRYHYEVSHK